MKIRKSFVTMSMVLALVLMSIPQLEAQALVLKEDADAAIAKQGFIFQANGDNRLNTDRDDPAYGDEQRLVYLTDVTTGERITEVRVGEEYILHCIIVNDGAVEEALENVTALIGQGDNYNTVSLNAIVRYGDDENDSRGSVEFYSQYPVIDRADDPTADGWARFKTVGKAKLYNHGGLLNGAQVNHRQLFVHSDTFGIYVGYDDQDGILPYGKEYACEIRVRVRLEADDTWYWSDPYYDGRYTGRTIENGQLVEITK